MREIDFMAWDKELKVMYRVFGIDVNHVVPFLDKAGIPIAPTREETILLQYIGIKDIHQKKIHDGNIVKVKRIIYTDCSRSEIDRIEEFTGEIVLHQYSWCVAEKIESGIRYHFLWTWNIEGGNDDTMEIIGDRYNNPEMRVSK